MKLIQARKVLEEYRHSSPFTTELEEAMDAAIAVLPKDGPRTPASARIGEIREALAEHLDGFDPFGTRSRVRKVVIWRQCVYYRMRMEGYSLHQISAASGYNHATVLFGVGSMEDGLEIGDRETASIWEQFNEILSYDD